MVLKAIIGRPKGSRNRIIPKTRFLNTNENKFYKNVLLPESEDGCMEWSGFKKFGYGKICINNKPVSAHRFSYQLHFGEIPKGLCVLHMCDNPSCVRPDHLFVGTYGDNNRDRANKGRTFIASGQKNGNSKLSDYQVKEIKKKINIGYSCEDLSILYHISIDTIFKIKAKKYWELV